MPQATGGGSGIKQQPAEAGLPEPHAFKGGFQCLQAAVAGQFVGGGVVADGNHQPAERAQIGLYFAGKQRERAADGHLVRLGNGELFRQIHAALR